MRVINQTFQVELKEMVNKMSETLLDLGSDAFLEQMDNKSHAVNVQLFNVYVTITHCDPQEYKNQDLI